MEWAEEEQMSRKTVLIEKGQSEYGIIIPAKASAVEQTAAEELQHYLEKATGATLQIVKEEAEKSIAAGKAF